MTTIDGRAELRGALDALARNFSFSWVPGARALFADLDAERFEELDDNPLALLAELPDDRLAAAATPGYLKRLERVLAAVAAEALRSTWWERRREDASVVVAYFSCEFGLDESLPIYSGGLGVLAGDHLKSAAELGVPLAGVGLLYRNGYFRQQLDANGRQLERYPVNDPGSLALSREPIDVQVELADEAGALVGVEIAIWRADVGRVPLYLLDTDVDGSPGWARAITDRLYGGDREHRIRQELVLGVGGVRALRALGIEPSVFHLNEGHSAFLQLERLRELVEDAQMPRDAALERLRSSTVFTTHTPVPAGNEVFDAALVERNVAGLAARCGFTWEEVAALGRVGDEAGFGLTPFALRTSAYANGVSALHGDVSRELWHGLWPDRAIEDVPIGSITNGVHARTWAYDELSALLGREEDTEAPDFARAYEVVGAALWSTHLAAKHDLLCSLRRRRCDGGGAIDPDALTIGFARRFATYKRADLLFSDPDRLERLLGDTDRPLQLVLAGKAHPADEGGKRLIQTVVEFARDPRSCGRVVFVEDYDLGLARRLVQGVDVWLNTPRRPLEASGTSGMKAALNGVLNCSILDGWWAEGYAPETGFAVVGDASAGSDEEQDLADAEALFAVLEQQVIPAYYERGTNGLPERWLELMRHSIARLGGRFTTNRMLIEYVERLYLPAHRSRGTVNA